MVIVMSNWAGLGICWGVGGKGWVYVRRHLREYVCWDTQKVCGARDVDGVLEIEKECVKEMVRVCVGRDL